MEFTSSPDGQSPLRTNSPPVEGTLPEPEAASPKAWRVLIVATLSFMSFFAVWVMFGIVGLPLRTQLGISDGQLALLTAIPILTGAALRIPIGALTDVVGGRRMMATLALITAVPAFLISMTSGYWILVMLAFWLGLAGTSFAVGVPWVSAWFPPSRQGTALGIFGLGIIGASITNLLAPPLVTAVSEDGLAGGVIPGGWQFVPFVYGSLLLVVALVIIVVAPRNDPQPAQSKSVASMLRGLLKIRVWRFGYYYMMVFGGYVALSLWLPKYYVDVYDTSLTQAGLLTAAFVIPASLMRPIGGMLSDRFGARPITAVALTIVSSASAALIVDRPIHVFVPLVIIVGMAMGMGAAAVFTYIPQYFPENIGVVAGLVGAVGGIGGFILPLLFAEANEIIGRPQSTFLVLMLLASGSLLLLAIAVHHLVKDMQVPIDENHRGSPGN